MKKFTLVAFLVFLSIVVFAQKPVRFGVYVGEANPMGNIADGEKLDKTVLAPYRDFSKWAFLCETASQGYVGVGGSVGFDVTYVLPVKGLGVFCGIDYFLNTFQSEITDAYSNWQTEEEKLSGVKSFDYSLPYFMNLPILLGVNYQYNFNNIVGIFGEAAVGPNFRLVSDYQTKKEYANSFPTETTKIEYDAATTLGFKVGAGVMMWDKMSIVLDFYSLGSAKLEGKYSCESNSDDKGKVTIEKDFKGENALSASELVVRVGYHF